MWNGKDIVELAGHYNDERKPEGFDTKQIFVSPSIRYAGDAAYAPHARYLCALSVCVFFLCVIF